MTAAVSSAVTYSTACCPKRRTGSRAGIRESKKSAAHLERANFNHANDRIRGPEPLEKLERSIAQADAVVNLAATCNPADDVTRPLDVIRSNLMDGVPLVDLFARQSTRLVHFATSEIYGRAVSSYVGSSGRDRTDLCELDERTTPLLMGPMANHRWSYATAKQLMERYIAAHGLDSGLPIIRPLNFFGPQMDYLPGRDAIPRILAYFVSALSDGASLKLVDGFRRLACSRSYSKRWIATATTTDTRFVERNLLRAGSPNFKE